MNWKQRYAAKSYLRSALWIIPLIALVREQIAIRLASTFDDSLTWVRRWPALWVLIWTYWVMILTYRQPSLTA
jgi:hypothetical protein